MKFSLRSSSILLLFLLCSALATAQINVKVPITLQRVSSLEEIEEGAVYAIGARNDKNELRFLTNNEENNKLKSEAVEKCTENKLTVEKTNLLWTIVPTTSSAFLISSYESGKHLQQKKADATDIILTDKKNDQCYWSISAKNNDFFNIIRNKRYLGIYTAMSNHFGAYSDLFGKDTLRIYKYSPPLSERQGDQTLPADGVRLCLTNNNQARTKGGTAADASDALLGDGTLAPFDGLEIWTAERKGGNTFTLKNENGYLAHDLTTQSTAAVWQILNGHVCTTESSPRYLCYNASTQTWETLSGEEAETEGYLNIIADDPTTTTSTQGVCTLHGGWTATALAALSSDGVRALDLTNIALPTSPLAFNDEALTQNTPIYIKESERALVPASWTWAVACGENTNELVQSSITLTDRKPLFTDRDISVKSGQITYRRPAEANVWQTLSLPFDAKLSTGEAYSYTSSSGETLSFTKASTLSANKGYLVRKTSTGNIPLSSTSCTIKATPNVAESLQPFRATSDTLQVTASSPTLYFLKSDESTFRAAAAGSRLMPFRAYLVSPSTASKPRMFRFRIKR